jgi:hypothetical protein
MWISVKDRLPDIPYGTIKVKYFNPLTLEIEEGNFCWISENLKYENEVYVWSGKSYWSLYNLYPDVRNKFVKNYVTHWWEED